MAVLYPLCIATSSGSGTVKLHSVQFTVCVLCAGRYRLSVIDSVQLILSTMKQTVNATLEPVHLFINIKSD